MSKRERRELSLVARLQRVVQADPGFALDLLSLLTRGQWEELYRSTASERIEADLATKARIALSQYPLDVEAHVFDVAHDAYVNLCNGTFLRSYRPEKTHPYPYILGCAFNYSRVSARSIWRQWKREHGDDGLNPRRS